MNTDMTPNDLIQEIAKVQRVAEASRKRLQLFRVRPEPPRGVKLWQGYLQWEQPQETRNITHYRVYSGDETNLYREVPAGQYKLNDLTPDQVSLYVSSWNEESSLESRKVLAENTAMADVYVPPVDPPAAAAPLVTGLALQGIKAGSSPPELDTVESATFATDESGGQMFRFIGTFTCPTSNYSGGRAVAWVSSDTTLTILADHIPATTGNFTGPWMPVPNTDTTWGIAVFSYNDDGVLNQSAYTSLTGGIKVKKGVGKIQLGRVDLSTYANVDFRINPTTGKFEIYNVDALKVFNYDTTQFDKTSGFFKVNALDANVIKTGQLKVGGVSGLPSQVYVVGSDNTTRIGWVGQDSTNTWFGGWFKNLWVGGTSPSDALVSVVGTAANFKGVDIKVGPGTTGGQGQIWAYDSSTLNAWIGADSPTSPTYKGGWFRNLWVGGTGPGDAGFSATGTTISLKISDSNSIAEVRTSSSVYGSVSGSYGFSVEQTGYDFGGTKPRVEIFPMRTQLLRGKTSFGFTSWYPAIDISSADDGAGNWTAQVSLGSLWGGFPQGAVRISVLANNVGQLVVGAQGTTYMELRGSTTGIRVNDALMTAAPSVATRIKKEEWNGSAWVAADVVLNRRMAIYDTGGLFLGYIYLMQPG